MPLQKLYPRALSIPLPMCPLVSSFPASPWVKPPLSLCLDYCNSLLPLPSLVSIQSTHCTVVPLLKALPWSAIALRIQSRLLTQWPCHLAVGDSSHSSTVLCTYRCLSHWPSLCFSLCPPQGLPQYCSHCLGHPVLTRQALCHSLPTKSTFQRGFLWPLRPRILHGILLSPSWH